MDELGDDFVNIESFLGTFPGDRNIHDASVQLVAATFGAIEDVIGYYAKGKCEFPNLAFDQQDCY